MSSLHKDLYAQVATILTKNSLQWCLFGITVQTVIQGILDNKTKLNEMDSIDKAKEFIEEKIMEKLGAPMPIEMFISDAEDIQALYTIGCQWRDDVLA